MLSIIREASHPAIIDGKVSDRQWTHDMITVHDPMPTVAAPMRFRGVMVDAIGWSFGLSGDHG